MGRAVAMGPALEPAMAMAADVTDRSLGALEAGIAGGAGRGGADPDFVAMQGPMVQNTFNVTVALDRTLSSGEEEAFRDTLVDVLVDSARRQGLVV